MNLEKIYPQIISDEMIYKTRFSELISKYYKHFKNKPRIFSSPGRCEIGGNHTDHQCGNVLAASITLDMIAAAAKNDTDTINLISEGYELISLNINNLQYEKSEKNSAASLIKGIAYKMIEMGRKIEGCDIYLTSLVSVGSGLSSSAAFEVMIGTIFNSLFCDNNTSEIDIAKIGQYAENEYFGKPSGLMDQMACAVGGIIHIDFKDKTEPKIEKLHFDFSNAGYDIYVIDSGADHADLTEEYSLIPVEMNTVSKYFSKSVLSEVAKEEFIENIAGLRKKVTDRAILRALHFFNEDKRVKKQTEMLKANDIEGFLNSVNESGRSSFMYLQNIFPANNIDNRAMALTLGLCDEYLNGRGAFRVHGGGFAGTVLCFVPKNFSFEFKKKIENSLTKDCCHLLSIRDYGALEITNEVYNFLGLQNDI